MGRAERLRLREGQAKQEIIRNFRTQKSNGEECSHRRRNLQPCSLMLLQRGNAVGHIPIINVSRVYLPETIERGIGFTGRF